MLCYLEGKTYSEVSLQLGVPVGTSSSSGCISEGVPPGPQIDPAGDCTLRSNPGFAGADANGPPEQRQRWFREGHPRDVCVAFEVAVGPARIRPRPRFPRSRKELPARGDGPPRKLKFRGRGDFSRACRRYFFELLPCSPPQPGLRPPSQSQPPEKPAPVMKSDEEDRPVWIGTAIRSPKGLCSASVACICGTMEPFARRPCRRTASSSPPPLVVVVVSSGLWRPRNRCGARHRRVSELLDTNTGLLTWTAVTSAPCSRTSSAACGIWKPARRLPGSSGRT